MLEYKKIDGKDIDYLRSIIDENRILFGNEISEDYSHDELGGIENYPEIVIRVTSTDEVSKVMKYASENKIPVVARGSGTGLVGASVAMYGGIMIETVLMNNILELDDENLTVTVEPGVLLMDLSKYVEEHDLFYPPDPGEKSATIGGNINTNAGGMRAVKYGVTRDYVRGLTAVLPSGEIIEVGGKVVKNSSGYSMKDLIVGSEGTLCIVTKAVLRLLPLPKKTISLLVPFESIDSAIETVPKIIKSKSIPTAIEFMEKDLIVFASDFLGKKFPDTDSDAYLLLTFDGNTQSQVESEYENVARLCIEEGARDVFIVDTDERKESVWSARGAFLEAVKASTSEMDECDVVVPRNKIAEFIKYTRVIRDEIGVRIVNFGHAGDGNLHIDICRDEMDDETWKMKLDKAFDMMYKKSEELNGLVSGEHGIGYAKKEYMRRQYGEIQVELMKGIKRTFDPEYILNPGKIFDK